jgi:hypothetical protein
MTLASCDCGQSLAPIFDRAIPSINGCTLRMMVFAVLAVFLGFFALGTTGAYAQDKQAQPCRTAADDAELASLEKELDSLQVHKAIETAMKTAEEKDLADLKAGKPVFGNHGMLGLGAIDRLTKRVAELDAALKENAVRTEVVKARIAALKALKPCPPENKNPPPKKDEPKTAPPPDHPCRTPEDDKMIATLKAKRALYQAELKVLNNWIKELGRRYEDEQKKGMKEQLAVTDKEITEFGRQRNVLEGDIGGLTKQIDALYALKPCAEEPKTQTTPGTGTTPGGKRPKKAPKHGKHAVSEDNPLYMENYTPAPSTKTKSTAKHDDSGYSGPSRDDVPDDSNDNRTNQQPDTNNQQPDIPIPH